MALPRPLMLLLWAPSAAAAMLPNLFGGKASYAVTDAAPSWSALRQTWEGAATADERSFRSLLASGRLPHASALATRRLFDLPEGESPRVTLYRDTAAWCPYCEKVWLQLEEKRVPYEVRKVSMNCYGDKPAWFWAMNPSGGIPVAEVDGRTIAESNDIIMAIEAAFPDHRPLLPSPEADPERHARVRPLLSLEREVFSAWFRWLTSSANHAASLANMRSLLGRVDAELAFDGAGPFFLGAEPTLVDIFFAPFLERMAASLPYYKGLRVRDADAYPRIAAWFAAMEARPAYRHIQSDYYTHVRDLPPQIGRCVSVPEAAPFADAIDGVDGASWALRGPDAPEPLGRVLQPTDGLGQDASAARREAAERLTANHEAVVRFAARGLGKPGFPPVSAELSDPRATPDEAALPLVDAALRHVVHALLEGTDAAGETLSDGLEPRATTVALGYLRDRISVPRDMSYPAALELRAHLNWMIEHTSRPVA